MRAPDPYIQAALDSVSAIDSYRPDQEQAFLSDSKTQDAVLMRFLDVGENLSRVRQNFPEFWDTHASDDWQKAIGLRNVVAHDYGSVDLRVIWRVVTRDLPRLSESLRASISVRADHAATDESPT